MNATTQELIAEVRLYLSRRFIQRIVHIHGLLPIFDHSQCWEGYVPAVDSWHNAYWHWVDRTAPPDLLDSLQNLRIECRRVPPHIWTSLPCDENEKPAWLAELTRQEMLLRYAVFRMAMSSGDATSPETYRHFADDLAVANRVGAMALFEQIAQQRQRHPTRDSNDRRLKASLLMLWIPGCLWALTTDGIAAFLNEHYPRSRNGCYHSRAITRARADLKLYRPPKPLWWGIRGVPPELVSLR